MAIKTKCRKCQKVYNLKDELAGKRFKCKQCGAPVQIPEAEVFEVEEDDWETGGSDDLFGGGDFDDEDYGTDDDYLPPIPKKKKKPAGKSKRKKKSSSGGAAQKAGLFVALGCGGLIALSVLIGVVSIAIRTMGNVEWQPYTIPNGAITVNMPGKAKSISGVDLIPGGKTYGVDRGWFGCLINIEPLPPQLIGMTDQQIHEATLVGISSSDATNVRETTIDGHNAVRFETKKSGINAINKAVVYKGNIYTFNYAYRGSKNTEMETKFLDQIHLN